MNTQVSSTGEGRFGPSSVWSLVVMVTLAAWIGASFLLDLVIMPALYATGMMNQPGFAMAGGFIFSTFNHVELLAGALVLSGCLIAQALIPTPHWGFKVSLLLAIMLMVIPMIYTYDLTPQMSGLGMQLDLFETAEVPEGMNQLHVAYWGLELLKLTFGSLLLWRLWRNEPLQIAN